jgi:hypothetical protein
MSDIHDAPSRMAPHSLALGVNSKPRNTFYYTTSHSIEEVLSPGYFDEAVEYAVRRNDIIEVTADAEGNAEFATLAVRSVTNPRGGAKSVVVSKLERR